MSDDFVSGLKEQYGDPGEGYAHSGAPWGRGLLETGLDYAKTGVEYGGAFARGAMKQSALAPGLSAIEPQGIIDWAKEKDPKHPNVEGAGRYITPSTAALAFLPDLPALAAARTAPWLLRTGSQFAQNAWKSALGGATEADTNTKTTHEAASNAARGAEEGMGTSLGLSAAQVGLRALPYWALPAAIAAGQIAHGGHYMPHGLRHAIAHTLEALAARAARIPAGLVGAGGEGAARHTGYEPGGSGEQQNDQPF